MSPKRTIVIGEDDEPIANLLRDAIAEEGEYRAVVVADGAMVLDTVRRECADLLILDIMMPGRTGLEVYDEMRQDAALGDTPVLFVSAATAHYDAELTQRGITDVIGKPFGLNDFIERVRVLCPPDQIST